MINNYYIITRQDAILQLSTYAMYVRNCVSENESSEKHFMIGATFIFLFATSQPDYLPWKVFS